MTIQLIKEWVVRHKWGLLITALALVLRTWQLGKYPIEFTTDEAALGYNAYSLIKTGHDENGQLFPIIFKSFGDYKPGLYIYFTIPLILIGGLTETMVRLPSALFGSLAVFLIYVALRLVRNELPYTFLKNYSPIYTALALALNPWHIYFSRGAWESNVAITMILGSIVCILYAVKRGRSHLVVLAGLIAGLSFSMYQGAKMSTPIAALAFLIAYFSLIRRRLTWGYIILSLFVTLAISMPILQSLLDGRTGRLNVYSILNYRRPPEYIQEFLIAPTNWSPGDIRLEILHGEWLAKIRNVVLRYNNAISPRFLFIEGDWEHPHMSTPYHGVAYWIDSFFIIIGLVTAIRLQSRFWRFVLIWFLLAPIPAALSRDPVSAVRSLPLVIPLTLIIGLGYCQSIRLIKLNYPKIYIPSVLIFIITQTVLFAYFADLQLVARPMKITTGSYYGFKQVVQRVGEYRRQNIPIVMSQSYAQPYIYFLFYEKTDPLYAQKNINRIDNQYGDVGLVNSVGENLQFRNINWDSDKQIHNTVFIGDPVTTIHPAESSDTNLFESSEIKTPSNNSIFRIVYVR